MAVKKNATKKASPKSSAKKATKVAAAKTAIAAKPTGNLTDGMHLSLIHI